MAAFIDTKKAFDCVNHSILIKKLELYGIKNQNLNWLKNYLEGRRQVTLANNNESAPLEPHMWCPAGKYFGTFAVLSIH